VPGEEGDPPTLTLTTAKTYLYFGGQLVGEGIGAPRWDGTYWYRPTYRGVLADRLGSVRTRAVMTSWPWIPESWQIARFSYYPYGEEQVTTAQDQVKFATYHRDSTTALDYADQRYYYSQTARFITADPGPYDVNEPQSFNRYAYAWNDPVNLNDPDGLLPGKIRFDPGPGGSEDPRPGWFPGSSFFFSRWYAPAFIPPSGRGGYDLLHAENLRREAKEMLPDALSTASAGLSKEPCRRMFGSNRDPSEVLSDLSERGNIKFVHRPESWGIAETKPKGVLNWIRAGVHADVSDVTISINSYENQGPSRQFWMEGNEVTNGATLIHELLHAFEMLSGSGGVNITMHGRNDPGGSWDVDSAVFENCFGIKNPNPRPQ
jgi:RHS repeat-associated protein